MNGSIIHFKFSDWSSLRRIDSWATSNIPFLSSSMPCGDGITNQKDISIIVFEKKTCFIYLLFDRIDIPYHFLSLHTIESPVNRLRLRKKNQFFFRIENFSLPKIFIVRIDSTSFCWTWKWPGLSALTDFSSPPICLNHSTKSPSPTPLYVHRNSNERLNAALSGSPRPGFPIYSPAIR